MNATDRACEHFWELSELEPAALSPAQRASLTSHLATCTACRMEHALSERFGDLEAEGPAPALSAEAERAWVGSVLGEPTVSTQRAPRRWARAALALAASLVLLAVGWRLFAATAAPAEPGIVFLAAGTVQGEQGSLRAGDRLPLGSFVSVSSGRGGFAFCGRASVFLDERSKVRVTAMTAQVCELTLEAGVVALDISKLPDGRRLVVRTAAGTAEALGTIFAVAISDTGTEVRVERGLVLVTPRSGAARRLQAMESMRMGGEPGPLSPERAQLDRLRVESVGPADPAQAGFFELGSSPAGAQVYVDGHLLGPTPLTAYLAPGERHLEARSSGHAPVLENVRVEPHQSLTRSFVLTTIVPPPEPDALDAPEPPGAIEPSPRPVVRPPPPPVRKPRAQTPAAEAQTPGGSSLTTGASAAELLAEARRQRVAADWYAAGEAYRQLLERHPKSEESRAALVPYAQLLLERLGSSREALALYEQYLSDPSAPLAEEASWGRIRALQKLGRRQQEVMRLREFLGQHPASVEAEAARKRLGALGDGP